MVGLRDIYVVAPAASFHPSAIASHHEQFLSNAAPHWQSQPLPSPQPPQNPNPKPSGILFVAGGSSTCQDCGNQAKKDCIHRRCRTCCKSRGFDCSTHIKSTWVSAARRRERHLTASDSALKKPRLSSPASNSNTSFDSGSTHQDASFRENLPRHVRAPAVFKCVRVTSVDDGEDKYAYHAKVNIGGHVFKGFLYNQGFDDGSAAIDVNNNIVTSTSSAIPDFSDLHLGGGGVRNVPHSDIYGLGGLLGGAAFGNALN